MIPPLGQHSLQEVQASCKDAISSIASLAQASGGGARWTSDGAHEFVDHMQTVLHVSESVADAWATASSPEAAASHTDCPPSPPSLSQPSPKDESFGVPSTCVVEFSFDFWLSVWRIYQRAVRATSNLQILLPSDRLVPTVENFVSLNDAHIRLMKECVTVVLSSKSQDSSRTAAVAQKLLSIAQWASENHHTGTLALMKAAWTLLSQVASAHSDDLESAVVNQIFQSLIAVLTQLLQLPDVEAFASSPPNAIAAHFSRVFKIVKFHLIVFQTLCKSLGARMSKECAEKLADLLVQIYSLPFATPSFDLFQMFTNGVEVLSRSTNSVVSTLLACGSPEAVEHFLGRFSIDGDATVDDTGLTNAYGGLQCLQMVFCMGSKLSEPLQVWLGKTGLSATLDLATRSLPLLRHPFQRAMAAMRKQSPIACHTNLLASMCLFVQSSRPQVFPLVERFLFRHITSHNEYHFRIASDLWAFIISQAPDIAERHVKLLIQLIKSPSKVGMSCLSDARVKLLRFLCEVLPSLSETMQKLVLDSLLPENGADSNLAVACELLRWLPLSLINEKTSALVARRALSIPSVKSVVFDSSANALGQMPIQKLSDSLSCISHLVPIVKEALSPERLRGLCSTAVDLLHDDSRISSSSLYEALFSLIGRTLEYADAEMLVKLLARVAVLIDTSTSSRPNKAPNDAELGRSGDSRFRLQSARLMSELSKVPSQVINHNAASNALIRLFCTALSVAAATSAKSPAGPNIRAHSSLTRETILLNFYKFSSATTFKRTSQLLPADAKSVVFSFLKQVPMELPQEKEAQCLKFEAQLTDRVVARKSAYSRAWSQRHVKQQRTKAEETFTRVHGLLSSMPILKDIRVSYSSVGEFSVEGSLTSGERINFAIPSAS